MIIVLVVISDDERPQSDKQLKFSIGSMNFDLKLFIFIAMIENSKGKRGRIFFFELPFAILFM